MKYILKDNSNREYKDISNYTSIDDLLNKEYFNHELSTEKNINYVKRFKSGDKSKHKIPNNKLARYEGYLFYLKNKKIEKHLNYLSYLKIIYYIFQEILYQIYYKRRSWYIKKLGKIKFLSDELYKMNLTNNTIYLSKDNIIRVKSTISHYKKANNYYRRYRFKLSASIRYYLKQDFIRYKRYYYHKRNKVLYTY